MSLDGYAAGPDQSLDNPLGVGGRRLHEWVFATRTFRQMLGMEGGDDRHRQRFVAAGDVGIGATIMGRNMFGPIRGAWADDAVEGLVGRRPAVPPPKCSCSRTTRGDPITMEGGTTFHFVTDGIESALDARSTPPTGNDVRLGGGASTDPAVPARRSRRRAAPRDRADPARKRRAALRQPRRRPEGYECAELVASPAALHVRLVRVESP